MGLRELTTEESCVEGLMYLIYGTKSWRYSVAKHDERRKKEYEEEQTKNRLEEKL